jgi:peptidoglycan hydrolase CwlO-like protein
MLKKIVLVFSIIAVVFLSHSTFMANAEDEVVTDLQKQINEYSAKLLELAKAKDTLANQIKIIDSQISLTLLKITQTENSIQLLEEDIENLSVRINELDVYLNQLSEAFIAQINQNYKLSKRMIPVSLIFNTNFNYFLSQYKYLATVQHNSRNTLLNMETARTNYDLQKQEKIAKQEQLENLKIKLAEQKNNLTVSRESKNNLLAVTKNDESRYQKLKSAAEAELSALLSAKFVGKRNVTKGEALGLMGNTGYSFGDHLHFGLYNLTESQIAQWAYVNDIDPMPYINEHSWPMNQPITITQGRGVTKYSYLYSDRFHHGIDMVSTNKTIMAVNDGVAYFYRNPGSSLGNHVRLFHKQ